MKTWLLCFSLLLTQFLYGQEDWRLQLGDDWFNKYGSKGLQVGDKMPDIPLGKVINNYTGKKYFADFKGKLVILDFWSTYCKDCIASFPGMEKLQQELGDKIQVILVNTLETEEQIKERQKTINFQWPNLPCIVADQEPGANEAPQRNFLNKLFPIRGTPHHVWIDGNGIIRLRGRSSNTYLKNINDMLAGKKISIVNDLSTVPSIGQVQYYKQLGNLKSASLSYGSFITPYNNELTNAGSTMELIDNIAHTRITRWFNQDLLDIYNASFYQLLWDQFNNTFWPGDSKDFILFSKEVDTLKYTTWYGAIAKKKRFTSQEDTQAKYCYEQIIPIDLPEKKRWRYMLEDLNRYFGQHLGIVGNLENKKIICYELVRTSMIDKVQATVQDRSLSKKEKLWKAPVDSIRYSVLSLQDVINFSINDNKLLNKNLNENRATGKPFFIINNTGWSKQKLVNMTLPIGVKTITELNNALKRYDLAIVTKEKNLSFLIFQQQP